MIYCRWSALLTGIVLIKKIHSVTLIWSLSFPWVLKSSPQPSHLHWMALEKGTAGKRIFLGFGSAKMASSGWVTASERHDLSARSWEGFIMSWTASWDPSVEFSLSFLSSKKFIFELKCSVDSVLLVEKTVEVVAEVGGSGWSGGWRSLCLFSGPVLLSE